MAKPSRITPILLSSLVACGAVEAQEPAQPVGPDQTESESAELLVPRVPGEGEAFSPVDRSGTAPIRPGISQGEAWDGLLGEPDGTADGFTLAERTFLNRVRGAVIAGPHGTRVFVAESGTEGVPQVMLLLPCAVLERFDEFVFRRNERVPVLASGQVFRYAGRNYLLPTAVSAAVEGLSSVPSGNSDGDGSDSADGGEAGPRGDPSPGMTDSAAVDSLIEELEKRPVYSRRRTRSRTAEQDTAEDSAGGDGSSDATMPSDEIPDNRYISGYRGRMVRSPEGSWVFVSDSDDAQGLRLTLLPCRMLESLEGIALRSGDSSAVLLSGRVFRYQGNGYLLPTLFERERRSGVDPLQ